VRDLSNEITVKLKCSVNDIEKILKSKEFILTDKFELNDVYYIKNDIDIQKSTPREILKSYILIRDIKQYEPDESEQGKNILKAIGYKEIMTIKENDVVYSKDGINIQIKNILNGENLIEIETIDSNKELDTIDKLKQKIIKLNIPIDKSNFFVKKAEIELKKVLEI